MAVGGRTASATDELKKLLGGISNVMVMPDAPVDALKALHDQVVGILRAPVDQAYANGQLGQGSAGGDPSMMPGGGGGGGMMQPGMPMGVGGPGMPMQGGPGMPQPGQLMQSPSSAQGIPSGGGSPLAALLGGGGGLPPGLPPGLAQGGLTPRPPQPTSGELHRLLAHLR